MSELLPCPFCGCETATPMLDHEQGTKWGAMQCDNCGAKGPEVRTNYKAVGPWVDDAIVEWSNRK